MKNFFLKIGKKNIYLFILLVYLLSLIPSYICHFLSNSPEENGSLFKLGLLPLGFVVVFFSPIFETILFQVFPIFFSDKNKLTGVARQFVIISPFALAHIDFSDLLSSLVNGISGGYILGMCYLVISEISHKNHILLQFLFMHFITPQYS